MWIDVRNWFVLELLKKLHPNYFVSPHIYSKISRWANTAVERSNVRWTCHFRRHTMERPFWLDRLERRESELIQSYLPTSTEWLIESETSRCVDVSLRYIAILDLGSVPQKGTFYYLRVPTKNSIRGEDGPHCSFSSFYVVILTNRLTTHL